MGMSYSRDCPEMSIIVMRSLSFIAYLAIHLTSFSVSSVDVNIGEVQHSLCFLRLLNLVMEKLRKGGIKP